ncbi:unnamed protein product [Arctia plantaginis]|uniref:Uncharacterized protein n=1 Tax=Arctia plantaginis TaxID=874455 RepID=A0A8S0ZG42_ARCPL|nr:unnamed protein product [Arctia plantaginis]
MQLHIGTSSMGHKSMDYELTFLLRRHAFACIWVRSTWVTKQNRWLPFETIILFVITLGRELATWFSRRGDSKAVNTEAQILLRIIYRQDCDLKMVQQDLT